MRQRPNILLLVLDSARAANLSCYGYGRRTTPAIDRLALEGTLFEQAISVGCWTLPVHASLFTGLYPINHGLTRSRDGLPDGCPTLARRLQDLGYETACFSNNPYISSASGLAQGFEKVEELWRFTRPQGAARTKRSARAKDLERRGRRGKWVVRLARVARRPRAVALAWNRWRNASDTGAALTNERVRQWLASERSPGTPFFVFINYMETHEEYNAPYPYNRQFLPRGVSSWRVARIRAASKAKIVRRAAEGGEDLEVVKALYDGSLAYLDARVDELVSLLEALGELDDTVVVVASDHGDSLGEHGHLGHRLYLYEQLVHVPLIIRYPAQFDAGTRVAHQVSLPDLYPTLLELAGDGGPGADDNVFESLLGPTKRTHTIAENTAPGSLDHLRMRMIRNARQKYIWKSNGEDELYDLRVDPAERTNIAAPQPAVAQALREQLEAWERSLSHRNIETRAAEYDEATLDRLRGLGYVG
jgi:arylsulfatase A-like enzyme